jgi:putative tricarboxylic transport membrane protein
MSEILRNRISGTVLLAVALVWIVLVYQTIAPSQGTEAGPRAFPLFFGYVLAVLSLLLLVQSFWPPALDLENESDASAAVLPGELTAVAMTIGSFVVYGMLLEPFGFIPSTAFVVAAILLLVLGVRSVLVIAGMSIGLSLGCYLVFGKLLGVYLPPGQIITIYF